MPSILTRAAPVAILTGLLGLLGAGLIAMPLLVAGELPSEWWIDVTIGAGLVLLAALNGYALAQRQTDMIHWRAIVQALLALALLASPFFARSSTPYSETTLAAGAAGLTMAVVCAALALFLPEPSATLVRAARTATRSSRHS